MDDRQFRKHLKDLAHGHHHPEEHDWAGGAGAAVAPVKTAPGAKKAAPKTAKSGTRKKSAAKSHAKSSK
ncbi:MAG TPA: hypothetical protein VHW24_27335 [Bryobacteraceae bacterium]|jgi:hypothetical protein|nr:hypothetical protein [Bryobacteraceae bacterium]